jgi:hypothetical protein
LFPSPAEHFHLLQMPLLNHHRRTAGSTMPPSEKETFSAASTFCYQQLPHRQHLQLQQQHSTNYGGGVIFPIKFIF